MEPPSAPAHRVCVSWKGLLLAATLLPSWSLPANAFSVKIIPANAVVGDNVTMLVHKVPENVFRFDWYKKSIKPRNIIVTLKTNPENITNGPLFSNRETLFSNGTLHIRNLTQRDKATYIVQAITMGSDVLTAKGQLGVYDPVTSASILVSNTTVAEGDNSVTLVCITNDTDISTQWVHNNQPLQPSDTKLLSQDNKTLTITSISVSDASDYHCEISNPISSLKSPRLKLQVTSGESSTGIHVGPVVGSFVIGVQIGMAVTAVLGYFLFLRKSERSPRQSDPREHQPPADSPGPSAPSSSASQDTRPDPSPASPIYQELLTSNSSLYGRITTKADVAP